jgi:hypothetical protein
MMALVLSAAAAAADDDDDDDDDNLLCMAGARSTIPSWIACLSGQVMADGCDVYFETRTMACDK